MSTTYEQAKELQCPKCGAEPGQPCAVVNKAVLAGKPLWAGDRWLNAGDPLRRAHAERLAAYAAMFA